MTDNSQWIRRCELLVANQTEALDLSQFRIVFQIRNADTESPNTAIIRVFNLSHDTVYKITNSYSNEFGGEFTNVILNAGYVSGNYGAVFKGTIKQYRFGRENNTDTYLDIMAADGDLGFNQGVVNMTIKAGVTTGAVAQAVAKTMTDNVDVTALTTDLQHVPNLRNQVLFGMARSQLRGYVNTLDSTWSIQDGVVVILDKGGYLPGEAVEINVATGLIGVPEQTAEGIALTCLLNSRIRIGGRIKLNNSEVVQLIQSNPNAAPLVFSQWAAIQKNAAMPNDGVYRAYVVEHEGDTRGNVWYSHLTCLAVDSTAAANKSVKVA